MSIEPDLPPLPDVDDELHAPFWQGTRVGELRIQACVRCSQRHWPPRWRCAACGCDELAWGPVSTRSSLFSWTIAHHPFMQAFAGRVPYVVGILELADVPGVRVLGNLVDVAHSDLKAGMPFDAVFDPVTPDVTLVQWRPVI